jgi:hypothetical protein
MESSLSLQYVQLKGEVGEFLGYGRGPDNGSDSVWSPAQISDIDFCVASGLRCFYFPSPTEVNPGGYQWSFLRPTATFDLPIGGQFVPLPDDFGGFDGNLTLLTTGNTAMPWRIEWRNEGSLREMYSVTPTNTGPPMFAAQMPLKGTTGTQGQRFQLMIFPLADQDYTLQGTYSISPDYLSGAFPYAYGGAPHAETILESCLAIAEQRRDDAMSVHTSKFMERLKASIAYDSRLKPNKYGKNRDRSDEVPYTRGDWHYLAPAATYNGGSFS